MFDASFQDVLKATGGKLLEGSAGEALSEQITSVATDNRAVSGGELFVAIQGERSNGNFYASDALSRGAVAVLSDDPQTALSAGAPASRIIAVEDVVKAVGRLARESLKALRVYGNSNLKVVGITGSVGKTTTKDLLADLLAFRGPIVAPPNSFNNELGLPLTVLRADLETATLVLEMGADHIGNIEYLTSIAPPDISAVLAVARAHLGEFGGIENVAQAKSEIVTGTRDGGHVVLNADDVRVRAMAAKSSVPVTFFSNNCVGDLCELGSHCVYASEVANVDGHAQFIFHLGDKTQQIQLGLTGIHHVHNALAAGTIASLLGASIEQISNVLQRAKALSPHRMDVRHVREMTIIDDSYNANPDSMRAGLRALVDFGKENRKIAVLGAMLELGEESAQEHADVGEFIVGAGIDVVIGVGEGIEPLIETAQLGGVEVYEFSALNQTQEFLHSYLDAGDVVLLKGSNGSGIWHIADELFTEGA
ncbi:UDP-N-acetylmuramoyl-tripeptide--D-alanyl-D-alanine ligase [Arcanobacterium ihumii]|uniref:UDP-N-acetylmuramoyl-tripeptide--D-alanyl-D- alanine ligase n=1 Tax=Arcanobacterium ihumii TaxID=2138162 RepID=UPI000F52BF96|nr:UDP-N-acetylmuramoyl-tripeptide--D-alanyl-D-alanine ligase [Arcanobacterium ihumii]